MERGKEEKDEGEMRGKGGNKEQGGGRKERGGKERKLAECGREEEDRRGPSTHKITHFLTRPHSY